MELQGGNHPGEMLSTVEYRFLAPPMQPRALRNFGVLTLGEVHSTVECRLLASPTGARHGTNYSCR